MSGRRSFLFTVDAIVAVAVIVISVLAMTSLQRAAQSPSGKYLYLSSMSRDAITILEKTKVSEARSVPRINDYVSNGTIRQEDADKKMIDIIGSLYANGNFSLASDILGSLFSGFLPAQAYYEIVMNNQTLLLNDRPHSTSVVTRAIVSGYLLGKPTSGYISRAWLGAARGNVTDVIEISPLGSGYSEPYSDYHGNLTFTKYFNLSSVDDLTAVLAISVHEEGGWIRPYVNGVLQQIPSGNECYHPVDACYGKIVLNPSSFVVGQNALTVVMDEPVNYQAHTHPGFLLVLNYHADRQTNFVQGKDAYETLNFTDVRGRPSAWEVLPFFIPAGSAVRNVTVYVKGAGVDKRGEIWINEKRVWYEKDPGCPSCISKLNNQGITLDITDDVHQNGGYSTGETNVLGVYFDVPATGSGVDYPERGAVGYANLSGASYVRLNYSLQNPIVKFNHVPYTSLFEIDRLDGLGDYVEKRANYTIANTTLISAFYHDVQRFSCKIAVAAWMPPEEHEPHGIGQGSDFKWSDYQIFKSPTVRSIPSTVYIPLPRMRAGGLNAIKVRDGIQECDPDNPVMTNSSVEYTILVPASVPYGDAFPNATAADDDARARLLALLAPYNLTGTPASDTANIAGISWLWGPSELKVVIGS